MMMQTRSWLCFLVLFGLAWVGAVAFALGWFGASSPLAQSGVAVPEASTQCAHWCIARCCALRGIAIDISSIIDLLPVKPGGHSFREIMDVMAKLGLETEARRETIQEIVKRGERGPWIAHLTDPAHFVVVTGIGGAVVHIFDGNGQRRIQRIEDFERRWSGNAMFVRGRVSATGAPSAVNVLSAPLPIAQFDSLIIDMGSTNGSQDGVHFDFEVENVGTAPLVIGRVQTDCSCVDVDSPLAPVLPGGRASITLRFNVPKKRGVFAHNAIVETNDPNRPVLQLLAIGYEDRPT
jgi:Protein of unknown function (DUF1573)/Peptidase C39 family